MPLISCRNVDIKYDSAFAVKGARFDLEEGDYLCVVGENGSGKSTLVKGLLGLVKISGEVLFSGVTRAEIGYMPQQTETQRDFPASVSEVVLSGCKTQGAVPFYGSKSKERAELSMKKLGIDNLRKKSYRDLSRGQQQRALLARALCSAEKLLVLDEPVSGLDPAGTAKMYDLLDTLNREEGISIIMISHDMECAAKYGNKILHMQTSPLFFGSTGDYLNTAWAAAMLGGKTYA